MQDQPEIKDDGRLQQRREGKEVRLEFGNYPTLSVLA